MGVLITNLCQYLSKKKKQTRAAAIFLVVPNKYNFKLSTFIKTTRFARTWLRIVFGLQRFKIKLNRPAYPDVTNLPSTMQKWSQNRPIIHEPYQSVSF